MLVAFSHLRWGLVWQRPQHLLSRFSREMPVLFVEEPEFAPTSGDVRLRCDRGVTVVTPLLPKTLQSPGFGQAVNRAIARLISPLLPDDDDLIVWYYTPMALGAEPDGRRVSLAVYDAMHDLASFQAAPAGTRAQEARLLARVDLVFTGGPTFYRQRRHLHHAVHCFPSGVEAAHFKVASNGVPAPAHLARQRGPVLGYFGVIDERIDLDLIARVAGLRPGWTIALVGPTAKIEESTIPVRPNIVRCGQQAYEDLPGFLAGFDIALLPFARNAATRAFSPTKTLEYLASDTPVVSTRIDDVVTLYGDVVATVTSAGQLAATAEHILERSAAEERGWPARVAKIVAANEWDLIAQRMLHVMDRTAANRWPDVASSFEPALAS